MPCDSIQLNSLEIGKMHPTLLQNALTALGATNVTINKQTGRASFRLEGQSCTIAGGRMIVQAGSEAIADRVKQAYSRQAVITAATKNGWKLKETRPNVFQVVK